MARVNGLIGILLTALAVGIFSCTPRAPAGGTARPVVLYPLPPDTPRIQFLTTFRGSWDVEGEPSVSLVDRLIGRDPRVEGKPILTPYGVAARGGKIYVCDSQARRIAVIDLVNRTFRYFPGQDQGQLALPINVAVDAEGTVYIADADRKQVLAFSDSGVYLRSYGGDVAMRPTDVSVYGDRLYVADVANHSVRVYEKVSGRELLAFPDTQAGQPGRLYSPTNLFVARGRVYVSDFGDPKVKIFTTDGAYLGSVGSYGTRPGQLARPKGIAVDRHGILYVVDAAFDNVQLFDSLGQALMFFGGPGTRPGSMSLPAKVAVDYDGVGLFEEYVDPRFTLEYVILVTNQLGPAKVNVYGAVTPRTEAGRPR